jgi:hypothetical protein
MNQFILNLNIIFNPYPMGLLPHFGAPPSPVDLALQAKQQLNMLQYSLLSQISSYNQMQQLQVQMQPQPHPVPPPPPTAPPHPACIVIDE